MHRYILLFTILCVCFKTFGQTAELIIEAQETPLNEVFFDLKERYNLQFAFDNSLLKKYKVTLNQSFKSTDEAIAQLLKDFPLQYKKNETVYLIFPKNNQITIPKQQNNLVQISGQVVQAATYEPLPFSYIVINNRNVQSDKQGNFNFFASADSSFSVQISHLGYFIYDTTITQSLHKKFLLFPQNHEIAEVKVLSNVIEKSTLIGDRPGKIKINHQIAPVLPGHGDNSVFNLLRLMPGILASGEQSTDLLIWGSYESHSKIQFDGFTVFGLKNFNDNISVVNPFMVKNIEIFKGGFEAKYGERVGGIVDISGKNGTLQKPAFTFNLNSTTINSMLEIPLSKKTSITAAYRQTYYQLYNPTTLNLFQNRNNQPNSENQGIDFNVIPKYNFSDANVKYTLYGNNSDLFYISLYGGGDRFFYDMQGDYLKNTLVRNEEEKNRQLGGALKYVHPWPNGSVTNITASFSVFNRNAYEKNTNINTRFKTEKITKHVISENKVNEFTLSGEQSFSFKNGHQVFFGTGFITNDVVLTRNSFDELLINLNNSLPRVFGYVQDELPVSDFFELKTGIRATAVPDLKKVYVEPRVSSSVNLSEPIKFNFSWGLYNQFLAKTSLVDSANNYSYFWTISNDDLVPVLHARHVVGGLTFHKNNLTFSIEGYHKLTRGISRYYNGSRKLPSGFYKGEGRSYGLDFYLKKEYKNQMAWISYTLSKTEEHFPFFFREYYKLAPHHQTHELKLAAIINFGSFYFSSNYVYGSGFERYNIETEEGLKLNQDYKRLDAALVYKFKPGKIKAETGISVLNVLNNNNIKYSNLRKATVDEVSLVGIYAEAVPFTPALFFKLQF